MKLLVINNLSSGFGEGAVYDFVRSFMQDGDEACLRSTDGTTGVSTLLDDAASFDAVIASGGDGTVVEMSGSWILLMERSILLSNKIIFV